MVKNASDKGPMTVGELIRILALFPRDKLIWIDGAPSDGIGPEYERPTICTKKDSNDLYIEPSSGAWPFHSVELDDDKNERAE